jgi:hypothetical protein
MVEDHLEEDHLEVVDLHQVVNLEVEVVNLHQVVNLEVVNLVQDHLKVEIM